MRKRVFLKSVAFLLIQAFLLVNCAWTTPGTVYDKGYDSTLAPRLYLNTDAFKYVFEKSKGLNSELAGMPKPKREKINFVPETDDIPYWKQLHEILRKIEYTAGTIEKISEARFKTQNKKWQRMFIKQLKRYQLPVEEIRPVKIDSYGIEHSYLTVKFKGDPRWFAMDRMFARIVEAGPWCFDARWPIYKEKNGYFGDAAEYPVVSGRLKLRNISVLFGYRHLLGLGVVSSLVFFLGSGHWLGFFIGATGIGISSIVSLYLHFSKHQVMQKSLTGAASYDTAWSPKLKIVQDKLQKAGLDVKIVDQNNFEGPFFILREDGVLFINFYHLAFLSETVLKVIMRFVIWRLKRYAAGMFLYKSIQDTSETLDSEDVLEPEKPGSPLSLAVKDAEPFSTVGIAYIELGMVTHDLNNILMVISTNLEMIQESIKEGVIDPDTEKIFETKKELASILENIATMFKADQIIEEQDVWRLERQLYPLNRLHGELLRIKRKGKIENDALVSILAKEIKAIEFLQRRFRVIAFGIKNEFFDLGEFFVKEKTVNMVNIEEGLSLFGYKDGLEFIIDNIRSNIFAHSKGRSYFIDVKKENDNLIIVFRDKGVGFVIGELKEKAVELGWPEEFIDMHSDDELIDLIFTKNFSRRFEEGTAHGLGLWLCRNVIEKYFKGTIKAENRKEQPGAKFTITIPLVKTRMESPQEEKFIFKNRKGLSQQIEILKKRRSEFSDKEALNRKIEVLGYLMDLLNSLTVETNIFNYPVLQEEAVAILKSYSTEFTIYSAGQDKVSEKSGKEDSISLAFDILAKALEAEKEGKTYGRKKIAVDTVVKAILSNRAIGANERNFTRILPDIAEAMEEFFEDMEIDNFIAEQNKHDFKIDENLVQGFMPQLEGFDLTAGQVTEALLKIDSEKFANYGFTFASSEEKNQLNLIIRDFKTIINDKKQRKEKPEVVIYEIGLGREPTEAVQLIKAFDQALRDVAAQEERKEWTLRFIGIDINEYPLKNAKPIFDALNNGSYMKQFRDPLAPGEYRQYFDEQLSMNVETELVRANAWDLSKLKQIGQDKKGDYLFHRHVIYLNMNISELSIEIKDINPHTLQYVLNGYLSIHNIISALGKEDTRYITEPTNLVLLSRGIAEKDLPVLRIPGTQLLTYNYFHPQKPIWEQGLENRGTGIYLIANPNEVAKKGLKGFCEVISKQQDFQKEPVNILSTLSPARTITAEIFKLQQIIQTAI